MPVCREAARLCTGFLKMKLMLAQQSYILIHYTTQSLPLLPMLHDYIFKIYLVLTAKYFGASSNGRTPGFGPGSWGSSPYAPAE